MAKENTRLERLTRLKAELAKTYGDGLLGTASDVIFPVKRLRTGVFIIDYHTGGGFPVGRIAQVKGEKSSGKTSLCLRIIANAQKLCNKCYFPFATCQCENKELISVLYVDLEGTLDRDWARCLGVDLDRVIWSRPDTAEQSIAIVTKTLKERVVDLVIYDSVAAAVPSKEAEGEAEDFAVGTHARLMNKFMRLLTFELNNMQREDGLRSTVILVNQKRYKIGVMFGDPATTTGGHGIEFATSLELDMGNGKVAKDLNSVELKFRVTKSKVGGVGGSGEYNIVLKDDIKVWKGKNKGDVYDEDTVVKLGLQHDVIEKEKGYHWGDHDWRNQEEVENFLLKEKWAKEAMILEIISANK